MNGMRQGLIIGAVMGLFFGFALGRYGKQQAQKIPALGAPTANSGSQARGRAITSLEQLPKHYLRPNQLKNVDWKGLKGRQLAWAVKVINEVPCNCRGRKYTMAKCLQYASQCKPNMTDVRNMLSLIRRGVHYTRVKARFAPQPKYEPSKISDVKAFLAKTPRYAVPAKGPSMGPKNALVTIVEFSDFQCPFCSRGANTVKRLAEMYKGKVRVVFKHHPLSFHRQAHIAAQASMFAHDKGKFWKYHDLLFANRSRLHKPHLLSYARQLGLDDKEMKKALDNGTYKAYVDNDNRLARRYAQGTPTFLLNGRRLVGAQPLNKFRQIVDQEIQVAQYLLDRGVKRANLYKSLLEEGKKAAADARKRAAEMARRRREMANRRVQIPVGKSPTWGPADAKVTIVEFSDFQCPFCSRGARTVDQIKKAYEGKVRVVFKHLPLSFHSQAHIAAQASMAAHAQGKFWEYHDKLFANYRSINKDNLVKWAGELGLDVAKFKAALDNGTYKEFVDKDLKMASRYGARGTPTFFVNGKRIVGAQPFSKFKSLIDDELSGKARRPVRVIPRLRVLKPNPIGQIRVVRRKKPGTSPVDVTNAPSYGPKNAPVWIVEFSDFQCPFCSRGARVIEQIKDAYKGNVRVIFKHLPLSFHKQAHLAAQASLAAHEQGKFWEYHDKLFANSRRLYKDDLIRYAKEVGLDVEKFKKALDSGKYKSAVDADLVQASRVGARGTPTFFVNGERVVGAQPFYRFKQVIDKALGFAPAPTRQPTRLVPRPTGGAKIPVGKSPTWGPADAKVTIVEFSDFQCPFCSRGANTIDQIKKAYKGKVRVVFKHLPLPFHSQAHIAAQASMAAHAQGKFWEYHDKLFANYRSINKDNLVKWAGELGLDVAKFKAALDNGTYKEFVDKDLKMAGRYGAQGTPTFFVNGHKIVGAQPFSRFKQAIDAALSGKQIPTDAPRRPRRPRPSGPVKINTKGAPSWGPADAKVTLVEFSDFQCPFCTRGARTVEQLKKLYKGKLRVVFKHQPLSFHRQAHIAAQASMAAHAQGKFWEFHDKLFANSRNINKANLIKWAGELGLDTEKFKAALDNGTYKKYVDNDSSEGSRVGANGTPTFFINGHRIVGAQPLFRFKQAIDAVLAGKQIPTAAPRRPRRPRPSGPVKINTKGAPSWGPADAKVTVVAFSDFQCPFCSRGAKTVDQIKKAYEGKVRVVFKHLPLSFHRQAHIAAQASMAAHAQGKFWEYHDKVFDNYRSINKDNLIKWAGELGLDTAKFKAALDNGTYKKYVDNDASEAGSVGANGTPTFFVNGHRIVGAQPFNRFKQVIDAALSGKKIPGPAPRRPRRPRGPVKINTKGAPSWGPADAKVTLVAFSDFQCPFCSRGANTVDQLKKLYKGQIRIVFKHLPLSFHRHAHIAAQASMAAHAQGKFWEYHDKLFANYRSINKDNLVKWAGELGLDVEKFKKALDSGTYKKYVDNDASEAGSVGANGTPTFFVNGRSIVGAQPLNRFKAMIDAELKK